MIALGTSKIWLILSDWDYFSANPRQIFSIATFQSAGVFYGGILGGLLWVDFVHALPEDVRFSRFSIWWRPRLRSATLSVASDVSPPAAATADRPIFHGAITFTNPVAEKISGTPLDVSLHPTQLYESAAEFLNFGLLVWLGAKRRLTGQIIGAYFILYGIERGTIEFFRGDPGRTLMFHDRLSLMQIVSAALVVTGAFLWLRGHGAAAPIPARHHRPRRSGPLVA